MAGAGCEHISAIKDVKFGKRYACAECVKIKSQWVHLRVCQTCGMMLCCDSSPKKHASQHARETQHPVVSSAEGGERWMYCYEHQAYAGY